ncbi:DoxX family membrane protein [Aquimarina sp. AD10]|uniref:DoxX family membrane protein n=1 Tax=Aquimarina TaxID=290174 RepID=UPI000E50EEA7|nr:MULTISPECIES: DoxX family membrane protein [Aquimarina]AXT61999.1 DoxX family membrane protein [Aquimarina sp. AD10]RKN02458.1 DoxX family membrane protein [Aquimarina sp. AD10]
MKKLILALKILLGVMLIVFGSNKFIGFLPDFEFANPEAGILFGALANSYILKTVGLIEVIVGLLLVTNKAVPFALILMAPISVNIILFHGTLDPANIGPGAFVFIVNTFLIYKHWTKYKTLF